MSGDGMSEKHRVLKNLFGHDLFRPLQEEAVDSILAKRDLLMVLPTGGGKSLCYQLPSLLMEGVTVVISPLLALMHDQVTALRSLDIPAEMISSMQEPEELEFIFTLLGANELKLIYVAPERLKSPRFLNLLAKCNINFFVIDEAHCVSEWGHEFRDDYRKLDFLRASFPDVPIAAFTATATPKVRKDIIAQLKLNDPAVLGGRVFRENMQIHASWRNTNGREQLLKIIRSHSGHAGIVYCFTRNQTETTATFLQKNKINARPYHAGLSAGERESAYREFANDEINVIVATIAFGMGIDKSNIRFVIHMSLPKTIENYYQEIGRAGRDGLACQVYLLHSVADKMQRMGLIDQLDDSPYKDLAYGKLDQMAKYAAAENCRHKMIASYFEDDSEAALEDCQSHCDNCHEANAPEESRQKEHIDITREAQMFLSAIYRLEQRFGASYIIDVLRGSKNKKILDNRHEDLSVYGVGTHRSKPEWITISHRLAEIEAFGRGEFQELIIRPVGVQILKKEIEVSILKERLSQSKEKSKAQEPMRYQDISEKDQGNFEQLKKLRSQIASRESVPAYIVFNDKTLIEMASRLPKDRDEFLELGGAGEKKYDRYGQEFLALCEELRAS